MRPSTTLLLALLAAVSATPLGTAAAQTAPPDRVALYDQDLFLNGGNVAWVNFAADVGPGTTNLAEFREAFEEVHAAGGNAMRLWLHTNGAVTPAWSASTVGAVTGPGAGTIDDVRAILDLAEDNEIGVQLCLWSFDMLRDSYGRPVVDRARALLTSAELTQTYIDNALTPMVEAVKGHPALLAWEVFNEPEGMSVEFGFGGIVLEADRVPMTDIQRFVNQTAGAIHRADPQALVTNGSLSLRTLTDVQQGQGGGRANYNYYADDRLVAAGGDALGTLDVYNTHYYDYQPAAISPFANDASTWGLDKPIVVAEFFAPDLTNGVPYQDLYTTLYDRGYAGAMVWQRADLTRGDEGLARNWPRGLQNMEAMFAQHRAAVEVITAGPDIMSFQADDVVITEGEATMLRWTVIGATAVTLNGAAVDATGSLAVSPAQETTYTLAAIDAAGLTAQRQVTVRVAAQPPTGRYEAEDAVLDGVTVQTDLPSASGGSYVKFENGGSVTWTVDVQSAGDYTARFGYYLPFDRKEQFLDVNGVRVDTVKFEEPSQQFLTVDQTVTLAAGANAIKLDKFFGYMNVDYLDVVMATASGDEPDAPGGLRLANAPNPFRSETMLTYTLGAASDVRLDVFDAVGRRVATLVDGPQGAGDQRAAFDASGLPSGVYLARLTAGGAVSTRQVLVVR